MSENQNFQQANVKLSIASMILVLVLVAGNAVFSGLAQWIFLGVIAVAIIGCSARIVANIHAERR
ncbi:hypothetical protein ADK70_27080 [Streptomyces rimosus subsp. pseudoverticillatus]|uniref:hypothetical protein n=1 Tax=Streptomyces rimosus TaxID=1927 RepID=UPI0006B27BE5|nr:hypothetical protein [Streptomyces rimosus]KOT80916.1 hypothetical protein ADK70_27080 [Streptomyces rimosus subsp. pseudoverticillatus]